MILFGKTLICVSIWDRAEQKVQALMDLLPEAVRFKVMAVHPRVYSRPEAVWVVLSIETNQNKTAEKGLKSERNVSNANAIAWKYHQILLECDVPPLKVFE